MYLDYWGLEKHAFNNVPDPTMYFDMHATVENAVAELLFAIEEADECLAVVVGEVGLGPGEGPGAGPGVGPGFCLCFSFSFNS